MPEVNTRSLSATGKMPSWRAILKLARVRQWVKNGYVFAPLLFGNRLLHPESVVSALGAFFAFCLVSSFVYILNDIIDLEKDRLHPVKRLRVLPSGRLPVSTAITVAAIALGLGLFLGFMVIPTLPLFLLGYITLNIYYSLHGRDVVIVDVLLISLGFVVRVLAGAHAITVPFTDWLILATFFLSLFLATAKRYNESTSLGQCASEHRKSLNEYGTTALRSMLGTAATASLVSYGIYTLDSSTVAKFGTSNLVWTVPLVTFGIFRYLYLIYGCKEGGDPSELLIKDRPLLGAVILWSLVVAGIIYL